MDGEATAGDLTRLHLTISLYRDVVFEKKLSAKEAIKMAQGLVGNNTVQTLNLIKSPIGGSHVAKVFKLMSKNFSIRKLHMYWSSPLTQSTESATIDYFKENEMLRSLYLKWDIYSDTYLSAIGNGFSENHCLELLNLSGSEVGPKGAQALASMLMRNSTLEWLNLNDSQLRDEGIVHIAHGLKSNKTLKVLEIEANGIKVVGAGDVAELIEKNNVLTSIMMKSNSIKDTGFERIAQALASNKAITSIDLSDNKLSPNCSSALLELSSNFSIYKLKLEQNQLSASPLDSLRFTLDRNLTLRKMAFADAYAYSKATWNRGRVVIVGNSGVGKTSTARALMEMYFLEESPSTVGIRISLAKSCNNGKWEEVNTQALTQTTVYRLAVTAHSEAVHGELYTSESAVAAPNLQGSVRGGGSSYDDSDFLQASEDADDLGLTIWDYSGQPVFRIIHHLFLSKYGAYLCVFNLATFSDASEETLDTIERWLNSIKLYTNSAPAFLVGTHADELKPDEIEEIEEALRPLAANFDNVQVNSDLNGVLFPIDNKSHHGIYSFRSQLERNLRNQDCVQMEIPRSWSRAMDVLMNRQQARTSIEDVKKVFESAGVSEDPAEVLAFFHDIGLVVYVQKTSSLKGIVTTKPQWLVDALSKIIRDSSKHAFSEQVEGEIQSEQLSGDVAKLFQHGLASKGLLDLLWEPDQVDFLLDLMHTFLLVSRWKFGDQQQEYYLVPCMTPTMKRAGKTEIELFPAASQPSFAVLFPFLPEGVFERIECKCVEESPQESTPLIFKDAAKFCFKSASCCVSLKLERNKIVAWVTSAASKEHEDQETKGVATLINNTLKDLATDLFQDSFVWEFDKELGIERVAETV